MHCTEGMKKKQIMQAQILTAPSQQLHGNRVVCGVAQRKEEILAHTHIHDPDKPGWLMIRIRKVEEYPPPLPGVVTLMESGRLHYTCMWEGRRRGRKEA